MLDFTVDDPMVLSICACTLYFSLLCLPWKRLSQAFSKCFFPSSLILDIATASTKRFKALLYVFVGPKLIQDGYDKVDLVGLMSIKRY